MKKGNIDQVARELGISQRRVHGLVAEGVFDRPQEGMHDIAKCKTIYEAYRLEHDKEARIARDYAQLQADADAGRPLRWTIECAAREFGVSEAHIRRGLRRMGLL